MYFLWIVIALSFFLENKAFFLVLSLLSLTPSKVGPNDPFATLPLPFSFSLSSFFLKSDIFFLNKRVHVLILSLYVVL